MAARKITIDTLRKALANHGGRFDRVLEKVSIISAEDGKCVAEMKVQKEHINLMDGLHGGFFATLIDAVSSWGLFTAIGIHSVSVNMHITYIKGAKIGDKIIVTSKILKTGKSIAFLEVLIANKKNGELLAKGSHTTFLLRQKI